MAQGYYSNLLRFMDFTLCLEPWALRHCFKYILFRRQAWSSIFKYPIPQEPVLFWSHRDLNTNGGAVCLFKMISFWEYHKSFALPAYQVDIILKRQTAPDYWLGRAPVLWLPHCGTGLARRTRFLHINKIVVFYKRNSPGRKFFPANQIWYSWILRELLTQLVPAF